ncbi:hypothetical protein BDZ94DRAFT_1276011 [Collybia nuda]|uniref:RING-type domain-containing protein n=1 Tax=Collybia nuda TaxID=64659 RepID=A0A9P5XT09_9AGAR|nr:hypothetical protein BDZ94DRAFT_1276011 [Collybia nuda]
MPLIIHPESSCDVCLENLTYDDPTPPYAIPCGHILIFRIALDACAARIPTTVRCAENHICPNARKSSLPAKGRRQMSPAKTMIYFGDWLCRGIYRRSS